MALINPVRSTNNMSEFISAFDAAFGEHLHKPSGAYANVHYLDEAHSLGFAEHSYNAELIMIYIGNNLIFNKQDGGAYTRYYVFGKNRTALYFGWTNGTGLNMSVVASKASDGKWNIFFYDVTSKKLYYNAPSSDFVICEPALKTSQANTPYIISPYPDLNGGVMSELYRVDYLSAFDSGNPPVLAAGDSLYAVMPYPLHSSETAAFAIPIDPADYEEG